MLNYATRIILLYAYRRQQKLSLCQFKPQLMCLCGFAFAQFRGNKQEESRRESSGQIIEIYTFTNAIISFLW